MTARLWQVTAPHFCAGLETDAAGLVVRAAPIIGWCKGRALSAVLPYLARKGWRLVLVAAEAKGANKSS